MPVIKRTIQDNRGDQQYNLQLMQQLGQLGQTMAGAYSEYKKRQQQDALIKRQEQINAFAPFLKEGLATRNWGVVRDSLQSMYPEKYEKITPIVDKLEISRNAEDELAASTLENVLNSKNEKEVLLNTYRYNRLFPDQAISKAEIPYIDDIVVNDRRRNDLLLEAQREYDNLYTDFLNKIEPLYQQYANNPKRIKEFRETQTMLEDYITDNKKELALFVNKEGTFFDPKKRDQMRLTELMIKKATVPGGLSDEEIMEYSDLKKLKKTPEEYRTDIDYKKSSMAQAKEKKVDKDTYKNMPIEKLLEKQTKIFSAYNKIKAGTKALPREEVEGAGIDYATYLSGLRSNDPEAQEKFIKSLEVELDVLQKYLPEDKRINLKEEKSNIPEGATMISDKEKKKLIPSLRDKEVYLLPNGDYWVNE